MTHHLCKYKLIGKAIYSIIPLNLSVPLYFIAKYAFLQLHKPEL